MTGEDATGAVRVQLIGDAAVADGCLRRLIERGFDVVGCLPASDAFAGECRSRGIPTFDVDADLNVMLEVPCDWILSVFNLRILPPRVLQHPARGVVNFHDGPLPGYAGLYAPTRALLDGATAHGVVWHLVDEGIDTGDLLVTESVPIEADDTALALQVRCVEAGRRSFERLMPLLREETPDARAQDPSLRTCFGSKNWCRRGIETDWRSAVASIRRVVDAHDFGPYPNYVGRPRFRLDDRWHALIGASACEDLDCPNPESAPGATWTGDDGRLHVRCGDGCLVVDRSEPPVRAIEGAGLRMTVRDEAELLAIERWDAARFRTELWWRMRLGAFDQTGDWMGSGDSGEMVLGDGLEHLICGLVACHAIHGDDSIQFALGWSRAELRAGVGPGVDPEVTSLLHPLAPVKVPIDPTTGMGRLAESIEAALAETRRRGPFLADILDRTGVGEKPLLDPGRLPIRVLENTPDPGPPACWTFRRATDGTWSVTGPEWAMGTFADLYEHRCGALERTSDGPMGGLPRVVGGTASMVRSWEGSQSIPAPESFMAVLMERLRAADLDRVFVDCVADGGATDREMAELTEAWMTRLRLAGVVAGDLVPVALDRGTPFVAVMMAVLCLGAGFVPLDPLAPDDRVRRILEILGTEVGVTEPGRAMPDDSMDWISAAPSTGKSCEVLHGIGRPEPDDVAFVLFTSGSTGVPRGVRLSHRNFDQYLETVAEAIHPLAYERSAWTSSVAFESSAAEVLYPVGLGGTIVVLDRADLASAASLTQAFRSRAISGFGCATALWSAWMKHVARIDQPIPETLRHVDIGGSVADPDLIRNWLELTDASICLMNRYGPTETSVTVTAHAIDATSIDHDSIPIGRPERGTEIRILDEAERRVPPGVEGEIWIGGGQVALGYMPIDQDQGGFRTLAGAEGRWFRSGDRGSWTPDGEILFGGRNDDQVKIAGYRIELNEVRQAIKGIEERREIDVLAIGTGTDRMLGVVVETGSMEIETDAWISDMETRLESVLPRYAIPRRWRFVESLTRTPSGKIDRMAARSLFAEMVVETPLVVDLDSPDWIAAQVGRVLGRRVDDPSRSFFELGGDSLGAMRLHAILEESCGRTLPLTLVHAARDIGDLFERLRKAASDGVVEKIANGHRRHGVVERPDRPTVLFLPGLHGEATLRHIWAPLGARATVEAIDLDLDRCRSVLDRGRGPGRFSDLISDVVDLVTEGTGESPPILVGYSIGGWIAFGVAAAWRRRGIDLPMPILIEPEIHVDGAFPDRLRHTMNAAIDSMSNLDPLRALGRRMTKDRGPSLLPDSRDPRGRLPDSRDREYAGLLIDALGAHRPRAAEVAVRLVFRRGRDRRFAAWHRLALGGVEVDRVDLSDHKDFFRFGSEGVLTGIVDRHVSVVQDGRAGSAR